MEVITKKYSWILLLLLLVAGSCTSNFGSDNSSVLAKIEDLEVTEAHFKSAFKEYYYKTGLALSPSLKAKSFILDTEFNTYVLATYAKDLGIDELEDSHREHQMITKRVVNEEYKNQFILNDVNIGNEELEALFVRLNTTLRASHLFAQTEEEAYKLFERVKNGETFEELAKEVFNNTKLANNGGDLGEFGVDEMDIAFEKKAYSLDVGEVSEPVRTAQGYSIIKVTDRFRTPIITELQFASKKNQIRYLAEVQEKELVTRQHLYEFLVGLKSKQLILDELWEKVNQNYSLFVSNDDEWLSNVKNSEEILFEKADFKFTKSDFAEELYHTPISNLSNIKTKRDFENFLKGLAYRSYLYEEAKEYGIDDQPLVKSSIIQTYLTYLAKQAENDIRQNITVSDKELLAAYSAEPDKFKKPLEVNFFRLVLKDKETADVAYRKLSNGASFDQLVNEFALKNEEKIRSGELGYDYIDNFGLFKEKLSKLEVGEFSEPLFYQSQEYHIYKNLGRKEPKQLSFKEAKPLVKEYLINKKFQEQRTKTIEAVKDSHDAFVNYDRLKKLRIEI